MQKRKSKTPKEVQRYANALSESLSYAEYKQAKDYVKSRSRDIDAEIESMRKSLGKDNGVAGEENLIGLEINRFKPKEKARHPEKGVTSSIHMKVNGKSLQVTQKKKSIGYKQPTQKDSDLSDLEDFLFRIQTSVTKQHADVFKIFTERFLPLRRVIDKLQLDLLIPMTEHDQQILIYYYSDEENGGKIDMKSILDDIGIDSSGSFERMASSSSARREDYGRGLRVEGGVEYSGYRQDPHQHETDSDLQDEYDPPKYREGGSHRDRDPFADEELERYLAQLDRQHPPRGYQSHLTDDVSVTSVSSQQQQSGGQQQRIIEHKEEDPATPTPPPVPREDLLVSDAVTSETLDFLSDLLHRVEDSKVSLNKLHDDAMRSTQSSSNQVDDNAEKRPQIEVGDDGAVPESEDDMLPADPPPKPESAPTRRPGKREEEKKIERESLEIHIEDASKIPSRTKTSVLEPRIPEGYRDSWEDEELLRKGRTANISQTEFDRLFDIYVKSPSGNQRTIAFDILNKLERHGYSRSPTRQQQQRQRKRDTAERSSTRFQFDSKDFDIDRMILDLDSSAHSPLRDESSRSRTSTALRSSLNAWATHSPERNRRRVPIVHSDVIAGDRNLVTLGATGVLKSSLRKEVKNDEEAMKAGFRWRGTRGRMSSVIEDDVLLDTSAYTTRSRAPFELSSLMSSAMGEGVSALCERRLLFEMSAQKSPGHTAAALVHMIVDTAGRNGKGFITVSQLAQCISEAGINMNPKEVELFASGFASDGEGGVDAIEVCRAIQALVHKLKSMKSAAEDAQAAASTKTAKTEDEELEKKIDEICKNIGEAIVKQDKWVRVSLYGEEGIIRELAEPFFELDLRETGYLTVTDFRDAFLTFDYKLSREELHFLLRKYHSPEQPVEVMSWADMTTMTTKQRKDDDSESKYEYSPILRKIASFIMKYILAEEEKQIPKKEGVLKWALEELQLMEVLLTQLEALSSSSRRRFLMSLQNSFIAEDISGSGDVDGFTMLKCLVNSGFKLQRLDRVRLLRSVEEMGGKMDYIGLCQLLLRTCANWTFDERAVMTKILKAMGTSASGRREWLATLRGELIRAESVSTFGESVGFDVYQNNFMTSSGDFDGKKSRSSRTMRNKKISPGGVSPSMFLTILRRAGVTLSVEEEATLLDCLDTEWRATVGKLSSKNEFTIPIIHYALFLRVLARHVPSWDAAYPHLANRLREAVVIPTLLEDSEYAHDFAALVALHELGKAFRSFDEEATGRITQRSFQVCCHRSSLLDRLSDEDIVSLSEALVLTPLESQFYRKSEKKQESSIHYPSFLTYLRSLFIFYPMETDSENPAGTTTSLLSDLWQQLLKNATDKEDGTLTPIRIWLRTNTDRDSCILTPKDMASLLNDFQVLYKPEELQLLIMEIGQDTLQSDTIKSNRRYADDKMNTGVWREYLVDGRELLQRLLHMRRHWSFRYPQLAMRIRDHLDHVAVSNDVESGALGLANRIANRLEIFMESYREDSDSPAIDNSKYLAHLIDQRTFLSVCRSYGIPLDTADTKLLVDSYDNNPVPDRIRCGALVEALSRREAKKNSSVRTSENQISVLQHLRSMLWATAKRLNRTVLQFESDVRSVFAGLDRGGGVMTRDDFALALQLLGCPMSNDLLQALPHVPAYSDSHTDSTGEYTLISYTNILDKVLEPPVDSGREDLRKSRTVNFADSFEDDANDDEGKVPTRKKRAVKFLVQIIRRSLGLFITDDKSIEDGKEEMLKVFRKFNYNSDAENLGRGKIPPRDFCLAISILMGGDEAVLTPQQWKDVVSYFQEGTDGPVDFVIFIALVLDLENPEFLSDSNSRTALGNSQQQTNGSMSETKSWWGYGRTSTSRLNSDRDTMLERGRSRARSILSSQSLRSSLRLPSTARSPSRSRSPSRRSITRSPSAGRSGKPPPWRASSSSTYSFRDTVLSYDRSLS